MANIDQTEWSAENIIKYWIIATKKTLSHTEDRKLFIELYKPILSWLINIIYMKIENFPFSHRQIQDILN